jgi:hypothetical protein
MCCNNSSKGNFTYVAFASDKNGSDFSLIKNFNNIKRCYQAIFVSNIEMDITLQSFQNYFYQRWHNICCDCEDDIKKYPVINFSMRNFDKLIANHGERCTNFPMTFINKGESFNLNDNAAWTIDSAYEFQLAMISKFNEIPGITASIEPGSWSPIGYHSWANINVKLDFNIFDGLFETTYDNADHRSYSGTHKLTIKTMPDNKVRFGYDFFENGQYAYEIGSAFFKDKFGVQILNGEDIDLNRLL